MLRSVVRVVGFGVVLSVTSLARADCTKDTDCKGDRVCTAGVCVEPASPIVRTLPDDTAQPAAPVIVSQPTPSPAPVVASPAPPQKQTIRRAPGAGMRGTGIGLFVTGLLLDLVGGGMYIGGTQARCSASSGNVTVNVGTPIPPSSSGNAPEFIH